ncbi:dephospho-CoA kinase [Aequorivita sp. 609]|uniref:dephospho-CoA kinase n=1 Tax=Aequorivita TaxID=153265 RepID=UPI00160F88BC|nr:MULTISPECIES: dephospho-CoA kinase [Aequorivita]MBB6680880.1 dephospho-CoA kinase [Aequorivita sp. 609]
MKVVGLTGGIGSGKTTVIKMFAALGVPVYIADIEAKKLTNSSPVIREKLIKLLGKEAYQNDKLNRKFVAEKIFNDKNLLEGVNAIIHPEVGLHFEKWQEQQTSDYVIKEAAILFENGSYKNCDVVILVTAPEEVRIARVMKRDGVTKSQVKERIKNQWPDSKKKELADIIIENIDLEDTQNLVNQIHLSLS